MKKETKTCQAFAYSGLFRLKGKKLIFSDLSILIETKFMTAATTTEKAATSAPTAKTTTSAATATTSTTTRKSLRSE